MSKPRIDRPGELACCRALLLLALPSWLACDAATERDSGRLCDPVADVDRASELLRPLVAGRDAEGIVYVLDQLGPELLVFVSESDHVLRQLPVAGEGEGPLASGSRFRQVTVEGDPGFTLLLETATDGTQVFSKHPPGRIDPAAPDAGEELQPVDLAELDAFMVRGLAGEVSLEYYGAFADTAEDRRVVVIRPSHDWSYDDFRVFIGTHDRMIERRVLHVERQRDGGTTTIEIMYEGSEATLTFPAVLGDAGVLTLYTFERDGKTQHILPLEDDGGSELALLYYCR
jgi:hypothetical protein